MNRRKFLGAATALSLGGALTSFAQRKESKPNVLFIFDDQLRADACSIYGGRNIQTPHIDKLAAEGMRFTNAISSCPLCTPYRGMLQTGRYPTHSGVVLNWVDINPNQRCIAHIFRDAGYQTGFIGKWHLSAGRMKYAGTKFKKKGDVWSDEITRLHPHSEFTPPGADRLGYDFWQSYNFHMDFNHYWFYGDEKKKIYSDKYETDCQADQAIDFMKANYQKQQPFFLMVAPHPPHPPFEPEYAPEKYLHHIPEKLHYSPNIPLDHKRRTDPQALRCYYAMCKNVDDNVGRIMNFLDESGLADNTIVVFTSDHGDQHGSHNRVNKMVPYAESVKVPLIIRWPHHISEGATNDALYTPIDHMTTLCGMLNLSPADTADGHNLCDSVLGRSRDSREAVLMANYSSHWDFFQTQTRWPEWRGVKTRQYTYCKWIDGKEELYDDLEDPYQMDNLADSQKHWSCIKKMRKTLKDLLNDADDEFLPGTAYADWYDDNRRFIRKEI